MAAPTGIAAAIVNPLAATTANPAAPVVPPVPTAPAATKTMGQLLNEIDELKKAVDEGLKPYEKLDTGRKKAAANRDEAVKGQTKVRELNERTVALQKQMEAMTKDSDLTFPGKSFDGAKKNALKSISKLSDKLEQVDKRLEKATNVSALAPAPVTAPTQPTATATTTSTDGENTKGVGSLLSKLPFTKKRSTSKETPAATTTTTPTPQAVATPAATTGDTIPKTTKDKVPSDEEDDDDDVEEGEDEEGTDDDDVISDKKKGN